jgi:hypothetical protein
LIRGYCQHPHALMQILETGFGSSREHELIGKTLKKLHTALLLELLDLLADRGRRNPEFLRRFLKAQMSYRTFERAHVLK